MQREAVRLRLSESRRRISLSWATPPLLLLMAWGSWVVEAPMPVTAVLSVVAAWLGYVVAFDYPTAIEVDGIGTHRVCLLQRQLLPWDENAGIVQLRKRGLMLVTKDRKRHTYSSTASSRRES